MYKTTVIQDQKQWQETTLRLKAPFAQSWQWGDILIAEGKQVDRLAVEKDGEIVTVAQVIYMPLILGWRYAFLLAFFPIRRISNSSTGAGSGNFSATSSGRPRGSPASGSSQVALQAAFL